MANTRYCVKPTEKKKAFNPKEKDGYSGPEAQA
jgi:hypothetical protein